MPAALDASPDSLPPLPQFAGFRTVFRWGLFRGLRATRFRVAAILTTVLGAGLGLAAAQDRFPVPIVWEIFDKGVIGIGVPLLALALVGSGYGEEVEEQTLVFHLVRPVSRSTVFLARYASGALPGMVAAALMAVAVVVVSGIGLGAGATLLLAGVAATGAATIGAVYYALAALFRRGLVAGLIYTFVGEGLFQWLPGGVQRLSIMHHVRSLFHRWTDGDFAALSDTVREAVAEARALEEGNTSGLATELMFRKAAAEPWTSTPAALLVCAGVIALALFLGARAVSRKDYALKD